MRFSICAVFGFGSVFLLPAVFAGEGWVADAWENQDTSTSCTESMIQAIWSQPLQGESTFTIGNFKTDTVATFPQQALSTPVYWLNPSYPPLETSQEQASSPSHEEFSSLPSYVIPSYLPEVTKTYQEHEISISTHGPSSQLSWSYPMQPVWEGPSRPTRGFQSDIVDSCTSIPGTIVTIMNTVTETLTGYSSEAPSPLMTWGSQNASPFWDEPSPYATSTSTSSSTKFGLYVVSPAAPSSSTAWPNDPSVYDFQPESAPNPHPTWGKPSPHDYNSALTPAYASESTPPSSSSDLHQPAPSEPTYNNVDINNNGRIGYAWTA